MKNLIRLILLTAIIFMLATACTLAIHLWLIPYWELLGRYSPQIEALTNIIQILIWVGTFFLFYFRLLLPYKNQAPPFQISVASSVTSSIVTGDNQSGGVNIAGPFEGDVVGRDKANTIIHGDQIINPPPASFSPLHQLPTPTANFTGRDEELEELRGAISQGGITISAGLRGMGGIGKTELALKLAHEIKDCYPDGQFYLDLKGTTQPLSPAQAMAHVIQSYCPDAKLPDDEQLIAGLYRSLLDGKKTILLMDNASGKEQVEPLIPPPGNLLLITSRNHFTVGDLYAKDLEALPRPDSIALLLKIAPRIGEKADELADICGDHPLALTLAASALADRKDLSPEEYIQRLSDKRKHSELEKAYSSLSLSYDLLDGEKQKLWRALAVFPDTFDHPAAAAVWQMEPEAAKDNLSALLTRSMVEWNETTNRYRLHDLARDYANSLLSNKERQAFAYQHAKHFMQVLFCANDLYLRGRDNILQGLALYDLEKTNIHAGQAWAAACAKQDTAAAALCNYYPDAGVYILNLRLHSREWIQWLEAALESAHLLSNREYESGHLGNLGTAYVQLGDCRSAIGYFEKTLEVVRKIGDRRGEGNARGNLGNAYFLLNEPRRAMESYEQYLTIAREIGDRRGEGNALGNLGIAYSQLGDHRRSVEYYEQQFAIAREIGDRRGAGNALVNLGIAYFLLGESHRAIEYYEKCLKICREIGDRRGEGRVLGNLGIVYKILGEPRRAIEYYEKALKIDRETGYRRGEGAALSSMSLAIEMLGQRQEAIAKAEAALKIFEQIEDSRAAEVRQRLDEWKKG